MIDHTVLLFLNLGSQEIIFILFIVMLLFGGKKLPELARGLGKGIREFKDAQEGVKREIHDNIRRETESEKKTKDEKEINQEKAEEEANQQKTEEEVNQKK